jgi:endoglucanase
MVRRAKAAGLLVAATACMVAVQPANAGVANRGLPHAPRSNPLAGMRMGVYKGPYYNSTYPYYERARGRNKQLLGRIALRAQMFTFGDWFPDDEARSAAHNFIAATTGGDPSVLSQMAVFRLDPWEGQACPNGSWDAANQRSYRTWIDNFAAGIGRARVALVLQPDLAFATCTRSPVPLKLVSYAAHRLNALPHTTVYIDGGVHYWPSFDQAVSMLGQAGIRDVRGFALNTSEYDTTSSEIEYGVRLSQALAAAGFPNKHFVISTAQNGAGFLNGQVSDPNNPSACGSPSDTKCVTLGIPPTTRVASPRWRLSGYDANLAYHYVDAYVWAGRPWITGSAGQFDLRRALELAASTPFP